MSKNRTIVDLRETMFDTLADLRAGKITVEQAKAVSDISQTIINTAKVEVDYIRANKGGETPFLEAIGNNNLPAGIVGITRHLIKG